MFQVCSAEKWCLSMADGLHERFSGLRHLLHLHVVQQTALLLAGNIWRRKEINVSDEEHIFRKQTS